MTDSDPAAAEEEAPEAKFGSLAEFVAWWATIWEQKSGQPGKPKWCPRWFEHPEAVLRLEAMWRSFEAARQDPLNGMATWIRDVADHHMSQLTGESTPFRDCISSGHEEPPLELTTETVPDGYFEQDDQI